MASSNVPVRVPEKPASTPELPSPRPAASRHDKSSARFVIKLSTPVPC